MRPRALEVMEAQYQNEVRLAIQNLYMRLCRCAGGTRNRALLADEHQGARRGLAESIEGLYQQKNATSADVDQARSDREIAVVGLLDAEEAVRQRKVVLGEL